MSKTKSVVSPKVTSAAGGGAVGTILAYYVDKVPFIHGAPAPVEAAIVVCVVSAVTFLAGYLKRDDTRI